MNSKTSVLWQILDSQAYSGIASLAENILILMYIRWLDQTSHALIAEKNRWQRWTSLPEHLRFAYLKDKFYPLLQIHAPMSGHLIGLILPTIPLEIPSARALSQLLDLIENTSADILVQIISDALELPWLSANTWTEIMRQIDLQATDILWEPACQNASFLRACADYQRLNDSRQTETRQYQQMLQLPAFTYAVSPNLWGRVRTRTEAMLSAMHLLVADQIGPHLDAYSLPRPAPTKIWVYASQSLYYQDLFDVLAPGGQLIIWHSFAHRNCLKLEQGGLEILKQQKQPQIRENSSIYQYYFKIWPDAM